MFTGGYSIPGTHFQSLFPCTSVFTILLCSLGLAWLEGTAPGRKGWFWESDLRVFILVWLLYLSNFRWRGSGDVVAASLQPFELLQHGHLYLDEAFPGSVEGAVEPVYRFGGHVLSKYSSAPGLCLLPIDLVPALAGVHPSDLFLHQTQKIGASLMAALSALLILKVLSGWMGREKAVLLTLVYAFGTTNFSVSSQAIWQHSPGHLFLALGIWALAGTRVDLNGKSWGWVFVGLSFAMAAWCRYSNLVILLPVGAWILFQHPKKILFFAAGAFAPLAAMAVDNYFHSGVFWTTGYAGRSETFTTPLAEGLAGVLLSPSRGLLAYSPFLVFSLWGMAFTWRQENQGLFKSLSLGAVAAILLTAKWGCWWGGWCFGPRLLADLTPLLILAVVPVLPSLEKKRWTWETFWLLSVFSVVTHAMGAYLTWKWEPDGTGDLWSLLRHPVFYWLAGGNLPAGIGRGTLQAVLGLGLAALFFIALQSARRSFRKRT